MPIPPYLRTVPPLRLAAACACMATVAVTTALYAFLLGPLMQALFQPSPSPLSSSPLTPSILPSITQALPLPPLWILPIAIVTTALLKAIASWGQRTLMSSIAEHIIHTTRTQALSTLLHADWIQLHTTLHPSDLATRLTRDIEAIRDAITDATTHLIRDSLTLLSLLTLALLLDPRMALILALTLPPCALIISLFTRRLRSTAKRTDTLRGELSIQASDTLQNLETLKVYDSSHAALHTFTSLSKTTRALSVRIVSLKALHSGLMEVIGVGGLGLALLDATTRIQAGTLDPAAFISFFAALMMLYEPLKGLARVNATLQTSQSAYERVQTILNLPREHTPPLDPQPHAPLSSIQLHNTTLSFHTQPLFSPLNATLLPNHITAIVGPSGSGKTSLLRALLGLIPLSSGSILLNSTQPHTSLHPTALRAHFAYASQHPLLLHDTIRANLTLAHPHATDEDIQRATTHALLHDDILQLPNGYDTHIGPSGHLLSGGQRQRLSIARALLKTHTSVLLLDEALTGLEVQFRKEICTHIRDNYPHLIVILVGHDPSTQSLADSTIHL